MKFGRFGSEFVQIEFSKQHCASLLEPRPDCAIELRHEFGEDL